MDQPRRRRQRTFLSGTGTTIPLPKPPARKPIASMTPQEKATWAEARRDGLATFLAEALRYRGRRNWPGSETNPTNQIYDQFLPVAADLLQALDEMHTAAVQAAQEGQKDP